MTQRNRRIAFAVSLLLGAAAFVPAQANDEKPATASTAASRVAPPPEGKGEVVFFRPSHYAGMAVSFSVHEGDTGVVKLGNGTYAVYVTNPGTHAFTSQSEAKDSLTLEVDAGETYYVQETLGMGVVLYRPILAPSDEATFDKLAGLKLSTQKPTDLKPSAPAATPTAPAAAAPAATH